MAQFLADIAGMLEILVIAAGFVVLHRASKDAKLLKLASAVLLVGGIAGGLCTGYYWFTYRSQGSFDNAAPTGDCGMSPMMKGTVMGCGANAMNPGMMGSGMMGSGMNCSGMMGSGMMGSGMMGSGMMGSGMMGSGMMGSGTAPISAHQRR